MSTRPRPINEQIEAALAEARRWNGVAAELIEKRQTECQHPISGLTFEYDGVSSHSGYKVVHGMRINCICGKRFKNGLTIHED